MREPPEYVRTAFGARGPAEPLTGGQGTTWRYGDLVLKPLDLSASALAWQARHLPSIHATGVRLVPPVAAADGSLAVDGWTAWRNAPGGHLSRHWDEVIAAGNHLHEALRRLPRPDFVDERQDRWAVADRIAWGEQPAGPGVRTPLLQRLLAADVPDEQSQLVHCDLTGNVLFEPGLPPAVIDLSLYWRPAGYTTAIVLTDAVSFEGAGAGLVARHDGRYLARAISFRLATDRLAGTPSPDADATYRRIADLALDELWARAGRRAGRRPGW